MPELIDREVTLQLLDKSIELFDENSLQDRMSKNGLLAAKRILSKQPTIEAEPVRHGRWLNTDETVWDAKDIDGKQQLVISIVSARCSVCNRWAEQVNNFPPYMKYEFCPHCGARMDGGADNG